MIVTTTSTAPYVEVNERAEECFFRSLEFVNVAFIEEDQKIWVPCLSKTTKLGFKQVVRRGVRVGKGLGRKLQGRAKSIIVKQKNDRFGL